MIEASAVVLRVEGGAAWVRVEDRPGGCGRCDEPGGCRSAKLAYAIKGPQDVFRVPEATGVQPGDRVRLHIDEAAPLRGALASYGLGALLLVTGGAVGHVLATPGGEDVAALAGGVAGLAIAFVVNRMLQRSRRWRDGLRLTVVREEPPCPLSGGSAA